MTRNADTSRPQVSVFLSFSRDDIEHADTVTRVLESAEHHIWRFTDDVRGGDDWYREMLVQVERADVVVFLASRSSVASEYCRVEIESAREHDRRIVVVRVDNRLATSDLPVAVRRIALIDLEDAPSFATALISAVTTDFELVRAVAALERRAADWDRNARPTRLLVRGGELAGFERLMVTADSRPPAAGQVPTAMTRTYVGRSRARRRLRTRVTIALVLAVAIVTGTAVTVSARIADERDRGEVASILLGRADTARPIDTRRALRLGIAADRIHPDSRTRAGLVSTITAVLRTPEPHIVGSPVDSGNSALSVAAVSTDGRTAAFSGSGRSAQIFDISDRAAPRALGPPFTGESTTVFDAAFAPSGSVLATATDDGMTLWDIADPTSPARISDPAVPGLVSETVSVRFSPDGRLLAGVVSDGTVRLWDVRDPAHPAEVGPPISGRLASVAFSPVGRILAVGGYGATVTLYDIGDPGRPTALTPPLAGPPVFRRPVASIVFSGRGLLATGSDDGTVILWDVSDPAGATTVGQPIDVASGGAASSVAFAHDGELLITASDSGDVTVRDVTEPDLPPVLGSPLAAHDTATEAFAVAPDGLTVATGSYDGTVTFVSLADLVALRDHASDRACALAGGGFDAADWARFVPRLDYRPTCPG